MNNKLSLENITMLLQAADRIRNANSQELRGEDGILVKSDKLSMIRDTMQLISGYLPETHRQSFNNALKSCNHYCGTYCNLKKHFRSLKGKEPDISYLLSTLQAVMPMLENKQVVPLRKVVSIIEAMRN